MSTFRTVIISGLCTLVKDISVMLNDVQAALAGYEKLWELNTRRHFARPIISGNCTLIKVIPLTPRRVQA